MNYGLLNFKAQNGKPQIFWSNEKTKKQDRKFGYKTRDQRYNIRQYPTDLRADPDNILQPIEPPVEEKPKKPAKNFIKRNKETLGKKNSKNQDSTVTLTQEQLNAILASVGKVASGREDALRISIDKNEIKVESPRRDDDGDHKHKHRHRRKNDEDEPSIFGLMGDKKHRDTDDRRRERTPERSDSGDRYRSRKHSDDRNHNRKHSSERDHRNHSHDRYRDDSSDRHRKHSSDRYRKHSSDRYRRDSRERRRSPSPERYRTPSRERKRRSPEDRSHERRRHSREDRSRERRRYSPDDRSRERRRHSPEERHRGDSSEGRHRKRTPEREIKKEKPEDPPSPREIAGIPVSLPWKHMTKAERRRLMLAREKVVAEETRKEEEEKRRSYQELESKQLQKGFKKDDYRRDDRDRYKKPRREEDRVSDTASSLKTASLPPPNGRVSLAEIKRRQWEKERADSTTTGDFMPWGKPGGGAPIRTKSGNVAADYNKRKDQELERVDEEEGSGRPFSPPVVTHYNQPDNHQTNENIPTQEAVPAAMRSSIVFGKGADAESAMKTKEIERQKWVQELDKQREEKRIREINELNVNKASEETWADKFSNQHRPVPLPDQNVKQYGPEEHLLTKDNNLDNRRTNSAPNQPLIEDDDRTFIRGQNVFMDPVTHKELEEKRKRHLEHQRAIMEQVQEKQRLKQQERERKMKEDMEEELKLQKERERQQKIFEAEIQKSKAREMKRQQQVENLKAAMDEAHEVAQREKYQKRMQHLEEAGHDVSNLKATLQEKQTTSRYLPTETAREMPNTYRDQVLSQHYYSHNMADILTGGRLAKLTPRATEPTYVPGLNLEVSPRPVQVVQQQLEKPNQALDPYTENRILTPSLYRHGGSPKREFGTQTANIGPSAYSETVRTVDQKTYREMTDIEIMYKPKGKKVRVKSATKEEKMPKKPPIVRQQRPAKENKEPKTTERQSRSRNKKRDIWNYPNKEHKKAVKQSEKDLNWQRRQTSEHRRRQREQELLDMVEKNKDRIPTERLSGCDSHSDGELTPRTDRLCRRHKSHSPEGQGEVNRLVINRSRSRSPEITGTELVPYKERSPTPDMSYVRTENQYNRVPSPPVPALKHRIDGEGTSNLRGKMSKYGDNNPLTADLGDTDFVPYTRTVEILDPAMATNPLPLSRETTRVANARKAYIKGMKPGNYGNRVDVYEDRIRLPGESSRNYDRDPITNPSLVTTHPTQRQDQILNQLSSLKESLIQRQRELETFSPTDLE